jgi:D-alanine-D-alanine ligase
MGGNSSERAISLSTGSQIVAALDRDKYIISALDTAAISGMPAELPPGVISDCPGGTELAPFGLSQLAEQGSNARPDVVIIALHGKGGEDGTIQGVLELLGIPYTGSGVLSSALAMDKSMCKRVLAMDGIPVPGEIRIESGKAPSLDLLNAEIYSTFGYPVIVKPNSGGSTIGCEIVQSSDGLGEALKNAFKCDSTILVEQFVSGVEITAGLLGNEDPEVLPLIEIEAKGGFYDYEAKYAPGGSSHIIPARISPLAESLARDYAIRSHKALQCRGMSRVDMMVNGDQPYVLEVNTIPGMTPTSLLPDAARAAGIGFSEMLNRLIRYAMEK